MKFQNFINHDILDEIVIEKELTMKTIYILFYLMNYHFLYFYKLIIIIKLIKHLIKKDNN